MATYNLDHTDLNEVERGGLIREEVMDRIYQLDDWKLPFSDMCSKGTHGNQRLEFTTDEFQPSSDANAVVDGIDIDQDDSNSGARVSNFTQTAVKSVRVSKRANASNSIGRSGTLAYQVRMRQGELRKDVENQMTSAQASVAGDGNIIAGVSAGLGAWVATNTIFGIGGSAGGFVPGTGLIGAPTFGTARPIAESMIKDIMQAIYQEGGEGSILMARPEVIRLISEFFFGDTAKAATMVNDNMTGTAKATAYASTNVIVTDFGTLTLVANREQGVTDVDTSTAYILDPKYLEQSFLTGYQVEPLAKTGLSEKRLMSVDYSLCVKNEKSQGAIFDVDHGAAMVP